MKNIRLQSGKSLPILGQGTWRMGQDPSIWKQEIEALQVGIDLGMTLIDTAELYGKAEDLVGEAILGRRNEVFIVSKVSPQNATFKGVLTACEASLKRLGTDYIDLYLLHWIGNIPFSETLEAFIQLKEKGKILEYGVSNFDLANLKKSYNLPRGSEIATNQVLYHLNSRGIEWEMLPWCRQHQIPIMAYSPFDEGRILTHPSLVSVASHMQATPAQVALAWLLQQPNVISIPKSSHARRVRENFEALQLSFSSEVWEILNAAFPPPKKKTPLEII